MSISSKRSKALIAANKAEPMMNNLGGVEEVEKTGRFLDLFYMEKIVFLMFFFAWEMMFLCPFQ